MADYTKQDHTYSEQVVVTVPVDPWGMLLPSNTSREVLGPDPAEYATYEQFHSLKKESWESLPA